MKYLFRKNELKRISCNKIPDIIFNVQKAMDDVNFNVFQIDVYVHMLTNLTETECYYLKYNKSNNQYENDLEYCIETLKDALKVYERLEDYEICQNVFTTTLKYNKFLKNS